MSRESSPRRTATAPLVHWLLLVCGLALVTFESPNPFGARVLPLWLGTVAGTALGQVLAWRRVRTWLVVFMLGNATWFGALLLAPLWWWLLPHEVDTWDAVGTTIASFIPAALCGYLTLSERGGLAAFWFPAVLWTLGILDLPGGTQLQGVGSWLLLSGLALLLVGFLRARETRRVGLWQTTVPGRVADGGAPTVLHETPLRATGQLGFSLVLGALTLVATAWIAPHLWQKEKVPGKTASTAPSSGKTATAGGGGSCCPEGPAVEAKRERVREYLPMLNPHGENVTPPQSFCTPCYGGEAGSMASTATTGGSGTQTVAGNEPGPVSYESPGAAPGTPVTGEQAPRQDLATPPPVWPMATATPPPPAKVAPPAATAPPRVATAPTTPATTPPTAEPPTAEPPPAPRVVTRAEPIPNPPPPPVAAPVPVAVVMVAPGDDPTFAWLLTAVIVGLLLHLTARPLRRWLTLRHLRRPLWAETVDQRVSNLWQLVLVGLRDAGWHTIPGEQPNALARRIGLDGLAACAVVLERARHGVRVDSGDLQTMETAAWSVYQAARRRAGWAGRAASSMRWPLV